MFLFIAVALWQRRSWTLGSIAFSAGVSVKMSLLLALPAILIILGQAMHARRSIIQINTMVLVQVCYIILLLRSVG